MTKKAWKWVPVLSWAVWGASNAASAAKPAPSKPLALGSKPALAARASATDALEAQWKAFAQMARSAQEEDGHYTDTLRKFAPSLEKNASQYATFEAIDRLSDPNLRMEWRLRFPEKFAPLKLSDLSQLKHPSLLDQALWTVLKSNFPLFFENDAETAKALREMRDFLKTWGAGDALARAPHAEWWRYLASYPEIPAAAQAVSDPMLSAWLGFQAGLKARGASRLRNWVEARYQLYSDPSTRPLLESFDARAKKEWLAEYFRSPILLISGIESAVSPRLTDLGALTLAEQKTELLASFAADWDAKKSHFLSAQAKATRLGLVERSNKDHKFEDWLDLGETWLRANYPDRAIASFQRALSLAEGRWPRGLALSGLGRSTFLMAERKPKEKTPLLEWSAEYYRQGLIESVTSEKRDELLLEYARTLEALGYPAAVADVYETLFLGGSTEEGQITGLVKLLASLDLVLASESDREKKLVVLNRYASLLSAFSRAHPNRPEVKPLFDKALRHARSLAMDKDPVVSATLFEVVNVLEKRSLNAKAPRKTPDIQLEKETETPAQQAPVKSAKPQKGKRS